MGDQGTSGPTHTTGTSAGEDIKNRDGQEAGREDGGTSHAGRAAGSKTARDSTSVNPDSVESGDDTPFIPPA